MSGAKKIPSGRIGLVVTRKKNARKAKYILVSGSLLPITEGDDVEVVHTYQEYQHFALQVRETEFGNDPPLVVYYRIVLPGALQRSVLVPEYWEERKAYFLSAFLPKLMTFRKEKPSASLSNLEEGGELVRIATSCAQGSNWSVVIFGVGRSVEASDPFLPPK
jgi:hypothetical protein